MAHDRHLTVTPYFTLDVSITQDDVGAIEGGFRVDFSYTNAGQAVAQIPPGPARKGAAGKEGAAKKREDKVPSFSEHIIGASLSSGSDWVFVSDEGFVDFDSTITLALKPDRFGCLLGARLMGRADLRDCLDGEADKPVFAEGTPAPDILKKWSEGLDGAVLPLTLAVTIDVPAEGLDDDQTRVYRACQALGGTLLVGVGQATFSGKPNGAVESICLTVGKPKTKGE